MKISELQTGFLNDADVLDNSKVVYKSNLRPFFLWLVRSCKEIYNLRKYDIIEYKKYLHETFSDYTTINYFNAVQLLFRWMESQGIMNNITEGVRRPKVEKRICKMPLTKDEVKKLKTVFDRSTPIGKRDYAIVFMMLYLGLRRSELVNIDIQDIVNNEAHHTVMIQGKGCTSKSQPIRLTDDLVLILQDYLLTRGEFKNIDPLFVIYSYHNKGQRINSKWINELVKKYLKMIGLEGKQYCSHSLRHTTATLLLDNDYNLYEIQQYMRHSSVKTTQVYQRHKLELIRLNNTMGKSLDDEFNIADETPLKMQIISKNKDTTGLIKTIKAV